jgi:uncharacterized protein YidB (DUF937 family)
MGLLDSLESEALSKIGGGSAGGATTGTTGSTAPSATSDCLASELLQMIQNRPGGLQGLVQTFHDNGMGGLVASWVSTGANAPISSDQVHQVLGSGQVHALAAKVGISPDAAGTAIAQLLPTLVNKLTPNGAVPEHSNVGEMAAGLLKGLETKAS